MDNPADNLDQTDEDILTYTVSDEEIEPAAGIERGAGVSVRWGLPGHRRADGGQPCGLAASGRALQSMRRDGVAEGSNDQQSARGNDADDR